MDDDKLKFEFQIQLLSWPTTMADAESILEIAKQHPEKCGQLSACACIMMVAALEQASWSKLVYAINNNADPKELPDRYYDLLAKSNLRQRVKAIPDILTGGRLQLDESSNHTRSLYQLIRFRNGLVHVREGVQEGSFEATIADLRSGMLNLPISPPLYLWTRVSQEDARRFGDSIKVYFRDVIDPEEVKPGPIIRVA
jgi:hypothetical protein